MDDEESIFNAIAAVMDIADQMNELMVNEDIASNLRYRAVVYHEIAMELLSDYIDLLHKIQGTNDK